jgi:hypothetical protein
MPYGNINVRFDNIDNKIDPNIYGFTFGIFDWGPIESPIYIDPSKYQYQLGFVQDENRIIYRDVENYLKKSPLSLIVQRIAPKINQGTFDAVTGDLVSNIGSCHSHIFLESYIKLLTGTVDVTNGLASISTSTDLTSYLSEGDFIRVMSDVPQGFEDFVISSINPTTIICTTIYQGSTDTGLQAYEVGDTNIWNETNNGSDLYLLINDKTESQNEPTYGSDQFLFIASKYPGGHGDNISITLCTYLDNLADETVYGANDIINRNYYMSELFSDPLDINEFCIVVSLNNEVVDVLVYSLDQDSVNYITNVESDYIHVYLNTSFTSAIDSDNDITKKLKVPTKIINQSLSFGNSGFYQMNYNMYEEQLELAKDDFFVDFRIMFISGDSPTIHTLGRDIVEDKAGAMLLIGVNEKLNGIGAFGKDAYGLLSGGSSTHLSFDITEHYKTIDSDFVSMIYDYKKNYDITTETIEYQSVIGDIAGEIIQNIINNNFKEINKYTFSSEILAIDEKGNREQASLRSFYINSMKRISGIYMVNGDYVLKKGSYGFSYNLIWVYIVGLLKKWAEENQHENLDGKLNDSLDKLTDNIINGLSRYTNNLKMNIELIDDDFTINTRISLGINEKYRGLDILFKTKTL